MNVNHKITANKVYHKVVRLCDKSDKTDDQVTEDCMKAFSLIERLDPHDAKQVLLTMPFNRLPRN